jgi:hypothetical protein
MNIGR